MAIIRVLKYDGPTDILVWKYPHQELGTWTQLIVNESQEAILFKGGQALDLFGPGRHTLSTENIPVLSSIVNIPFGGKSPFTAEVWYINKLRSMDIKWGTSAPIQLQEPKYQLMMSVRAFGQLSVEIADSRMFMTRLIGTTSVFHQDALYNYFRGILMMNIKELISSFLVHKKISILDIHAYISDISRHVEERVAPAFADAGLRLVNLNIESINLPDNDPTTKRLKEALTKKAEMEILGFNYQQARAFDTLEQAAKNEGTQSAFMNAGIGLGLGSGLGNAVGSVMPQLGSQLQAAGQHRVCPQCKDVNPADFNFCKSCGSSLRETVQQQEQILCQSCGKPVLPGSKFCAHCGDPYHPCPKCKADNLPDAEICGKCGTDLGKPCKQCGTTVSKDVKFCPECGTSMLLTCGQCKHEVKPGQKFCLECGHKLL
jgi:membrane protease subunit (stomatin/prohibitin family)